MLEPNIAKDPTLIKGMASMEKELAMFDFPKCLVAVPQLSVFDKGDVVRLKIGPAAGRLGYVFIPRNGNFRDYEPYAKPDAIGVAVYERVKADPLIERIAEAISGEEGPYHQWQVRWADGPEQLDLVERANKGM